MKGRTVIERLSHEYDNFFDEPRYQVRWDRLKALYSKDYLSFRVLFVVETLGLLDKWREPTPRELNAILLQKMAGGQVAISSALKFRQNWHGIPLEAAIAL